MKKSIKRISTTILLFIMAVVLCIAGGLFIRSDGATVVAAEAPTKITFSTEAKAIAPGEKMTLEMVISTSEAGTWESIGLSFAPLLADGSKADATICQYLELDLSDEDSICDNTDVKNNYTLIYNDNFSAGTGAQVNCVIDMGADPVATSTSLKFTFDVKLKADAPDNIKNVTFGIAPLKANVVSFKDPSGVSVKHQGDQKVYKNNKVDRDFVGDCMSWNTVVIYVGVISSDNSLKSLEGGIDAGSKTSITVADSMTATAAGSGHAYVLNAVVNDTGATLKWGVGSTATTAVDSGTDFNVTLDNSGETTVTIEVTAEDASKKNYTIVITSSYAALDLTAANVTLNGSQGSFGLDNTDNTTLAHVINIPSDCTEAKLKPTIIANYGMATDIAVAATGCTASPASTVASGSDLTITDIAEGNSFKLTVTAKSGATAEYTFTFKVASVDTSISSITMTESVTNATVNNDAAKATSNSVDYYFLLSEDSGFKGKFNITTTASGATVKINGSAYSNTTEYTAATYTITVTAEAGNTQDYKAMVAQDLKTGSLKDLQYSLINQSNWKSAVQDDGDTLKVTKDDNDPNNVKYTIVMVLDPSTYTGKTM